MEPLATDYRSTCSGPENRIFDPLGGTSRSSMGDVDANGQPLKNICLVKSLRDLGEDIECSVSGPFRALEHGNPMLRSAGKQLVPVRYADVGPGEYVHWSRNHFMAMKIGRTISVKRGHHWDIVSSLECLGSPTQQRFFKLVDTPANHTVQTETLPTPHQHSKCPVPRHTTTGPTQRQLWSIMQSRDRAVLRRMYTAEQPPPVQPHTKRQRIGDSTTSSSVRPVEANMVISHGQLHRPSPRCDGLTLSCQRHPKISHVYYLSFHKFASSRC